jgi:hypothetical protein
MKVLVLGAETSGALRRTLAAAVLPISIASSRKNGSCAGGVGRWPGSPFTMGKINVARLIS